MNKQTPAVNSGSNKITLIAVNIIIIVTLILLSPLLVEVRDKIPFLKEQNKENIGGELRSGNESIKYYSADSTDIDLSFLSSSAEQLISVKARNNGELLFFYSDYVEHYGDVLRLSKKSADGSSIVSEYFLSGNFLASVMANSYVFTDYNDNFFYISNDKAGYFFNSDTMEMIKMYRFPRDLNIYQCVLSNNREMFAISAESGFFVCDEDFGNRKELISTIYALNDIVITPKYPVWSEDDEYIYYTLYANEFISAAGRTTLMPGGNEQYPELSAVKFNFIDKGKIFYRYSSSYHVGTENLFRCGYFDIESKSMKDAIQSSVYYYDVKTGKTGNFIAALSNNGYMKKMNIIDINSKKTVYSDLFDNISEFTFSPDETKLVMRTYKNGERILRLISIYES